MLINTQQLKIKYENVVNILRLNIGACAIYKYLDRLTRDQMS